VPLVHFFFWKTAFIITALFSLKVYSIRSHRTSPARPNCRGSRSGKNVLSAITPIPLIFPSPWSMSCRESPQTVRQVKRASAPYCSEGIIKQSNSSRLRRVPRQTAATVPAKGRPGRSDIHGARSLRRKAIPATVKPRNGRFSSPLWSRTEDFPASSCQLAPSKPSGRI